MSELLAHIQELNIKTRAWIAEDPGTRWATIVCEDMAVWAERGIYTIAQFKRMCDEELAFELYRSAFGIKPRHINFSEMSDEDLQYSINSWSEIAKEELEREEEDFKRLLNEFEGQIAEAMAIGNVDRATAIRWMMDAEDLNFNDAGELEEFLISHKGLCTRDASNIIQNLSKKE